MAKKVKPPKAEPLSAPTGLAVPFDGTAFSASWQPHPEASKYSVATVAAYDYNRDGIVDEVVDDDYGTAGPSVIIPFADFLLAQDDGTVARPTQVSFRVKAIGMGKARGRALFSEPVTILTP
jgi:hypothetical protein